MELGVIRPASLTPVQYSRSQQFALRRPILGCRASPNGTGSSDECCHNHAQPSNGAKASEAAAAPVQSSSSSSSDSSKGMPRPAQPADASQAPGQRRSPPSSSSSIMQNFPPKRPQQQQQQQARRKQLDVNRAVQLLKLTAWRSDNKSTSKLPPWFMRTRDDFDSTAGSAWSSDGSGSTGSSTGANQHGSTGSSSSTSSSSKGKPLAAIDTLDDLAAADAESETTPGARSTTSSSNRGTAMGSRWRSSTPASGSSNGNGNGSSSRGGRRGRMYSASDPIRRPRSRGSKQEWSLMPWQEGGDAFKEDERKFRRAVFSFERWAAHRSTWRYLRHFRGIFSSRTLLGLLPAVAFFTGMAAIAGVYNTYAVDTGAPAFALSSTSLDITAFAVSLLLVFRTDSSYARWEEALKTWNEVRSLSKDLARQSCYWVNDTPRKEMLIRWSEAFSRALLVHCREDGSLESELEDVLQPHEVAAVAAVGPGGAPAFVLQVVSELIEQCGVSDIKEDKMFSTLRAMGDTIAVCDKLLRYPLPLAWSRHTSRFMFLWLSALPWSMWPEAHWGVVPITGVISYLLLGIDEIGVQIEEPFGILPLEDVCIDIQSEIDAMMERQDIVTDLLVAGGVDCEPRSTCGACGGPIPAAATAAAAAASAGKPAAAGVAASRAAASSNSGCSSSGCSSGSPSMTVQ